MCENPFSRKTRINAGKLTAYLVSQTEHVSRLLVRRFFGKVRTVAQLLKHESKRAIDKPKTFPTRTFATPPARPTQQTGRPVV